MEDVKEEVVDTQDPGLRRLSEVMDKRIDDIFAELREVEGLMNVLKPFTPPKNPEQVEAGDGLVGEYIQLVLGLNVVFDKIRYIKEHLIVTIGSPAH